jgi:hypothetical protein
MIVKSVLALRLSKRFWGKVKITKHPQRCWEWTASKNKAGYGQIQVGGVDGRPMLAHRVSWIVHNGAIPRDLHVLHDCNNPGCVRPGHLRLGTDLDNTRDAFLKGKVARGKRLPHTRLTVRQVVEIRRALSALVKTISKKYKISTSMVHAILRRERR